MPRALRSSPRDSDPNLLGVQLPRAQVLQLRSALRELLAQRAGERVEAWRQSVLHSLRILTGSDKAILVARTAAGPSVYGEDVCQDLLSAYVSRFADLDRSRVAATEHGLEVWSLSQLWPAGELERSKYYESFAAPNRLHGTVGVTLHFASPRAEVCLVFHKAEPGSAAAIEHRRQLLGLLLEPIRAGFGMDLGNGDPIPQMSSLIDVTGQALALYSLDGRELTQNPVMRRMLAQDQEHDALLDQIRGVARSVLACLANGGEPRGRTHRQADGTRREVATSQAAYRLRGNLVGRSPLGHGTAILVSLDRVAFEVPAPDSLRARYGLTLRELQVASLLMHRLTNTEIARMLSISPHTARHHTESVLAKFGVRSRDALRRAITEIPSS
jgi:DNA-binding CsgD family transcriptional regulator